MLGLTIGRGYIIDPEKTRAMFYRDWKIRLNKMKSKMKWHMQTGDVKAARDTQKLMTWMILQNSPSEK